MKEANSSIFFAGIDVGSSFTKVVVIDSEGGVVGERVVKTSLNMAEGANSSFMGLLKEHHITRKEIAFICATGLGRENIDFADMKKTEISAHAIGVSRLFSGPLTIVDIGGQDTKVIVIDQNGRLLDFRMNRKCAAGTGAFLEEIAERLGIMVSDINILAEKGDRTIDIGSYCAVFTKTEILAKMREGDSLENILRGVLDSVAKRVIEMANFHHHPIVLTGGVIAFNPLLKTFIEKRLDNKVLLPPSPQTVGAFGSAILAREEFIKKGGGAIPATPR